jgi:hypothetical protein
VTNLTLFSNSIFCNLKIEQKVANIQYKIKMEKLLEKKEETPKWRSPIDPVLLSTAPHFIALLFVAGCQDPIKYPGLYTGYSVVVGTSSLLSLLWHGQHEKKNILFWLDYGFAFVWAAYDGVLGLTVASVPSFITILLLNGICILTNHLGDWLSKNNYMSYQKAHSTWHLLNVVKSIFVSYLIGCRWRNDCGCI